jgi:hypothetical protein
MTEEATAVLLDEEHQGVACRMAVNRSPWPEARDAQVPQPVLPSAHPTPFQARALRWQSEMFHTGARRWGGGHGGAPW